MAHSPFNDVKFELGVILVVGVLLLLVQRPIDLPGWLSWLLLLGYGLVGMLWLLIRTHRVLRRQEQEHHRGP